MGKPKTKERRSSANGVPNTASEMPANPLTLNADSLPDLSLSVLAKLKRRIEQGFQDQEPQSQKDKKVSLSELKQKTNAGPQSEPKAVNKKGKKRDRNGEIIAPQEGKEKPRSKFDERGENGNLLENEIYAIGGTKEDYDLLADVESDSEMEIFEDTPRKYSAKAVNEHTLRNDIEKMLKGDNPSPPPKPASKKAVVADIVPIDPKPAKESKSLQQVKPSKEAPKQNTLKKPNPNQEEVSVPGRLAQQRDTRSSNLVSFYFPFLSNLAQN